MHKCNAKTKKKHTHFHRFCCCCVYSLICLVEKQVSQPVDKAFCQGGTSGPLRHTKVLMCRCTWHKNELLSSQKAEALQHEKHRQPSQIVTVLWAILFNHFVSAFVWKIMQSRSLCITRVGVVGFEGSLFINSKAIFDYFPGIRWHDEAEGN